MEKTPRSGLGNAVGGGGSSSSRFPKRSRTNQMQEQIHQGAAVPFFEEDEEEGGDEQHNQQQRAPAPETRSTNNVGGKGETRTDPVKRTNNGPVSVTLNDSEVLDCPVCYEALTIPVYQCGNGHILCDRCCTGLLNRCPSCRQPLGHLRCTAIEKVLESIQVKCEHSDYGCKETMSYSKKYDHGKDCLHAPCRCPFPACNFLGSFSQIYQHFKVLHKHSAEVFAYYKLLRIALSAHHDLIFLQEEKDADLFILNNTKEPRGYRISLNSIAPSSKGGFEYSLVAKSGGIVYKFNSCTKSIQNWDDNDPPSVASLLLPSDFLGAYGQLNLEIRIQRPTKF